MAVYNPGGYLRAAMESILAQSCAEFELLIVDDGSTDETGAVLADYAARDARIRVLRHERNLGLCAALNGALAAARGRYIARQDGDDVSFRGRLAAQREYLDTHGEVGLLGTAYVEIDAAGLPVRTCCPPPTDTGIRWRMLFHNAFCHTSVMFRRELIAGDSRPYDAAYLHAEDYGLWSRLLERSRGANLPEPLVCYRMHEAGVSATWRSMQAETCARIAAARIAAFVPDVELCGNEVERLRAWTAAFPAQLGGEDVPLCAKFLRILAAFTRRPGLDGEVVRRICDCWEGRVRKAVGEDAWRSLNAQRAAWPTGS